jgi:hypothetical protein
LDAKVVGRRKDLSDTDIARVDQVGVGQEVASGEDCVATLDGVALNHLAYLLLTNLLRAGAGKMRRSRTMMLAGPLLPSSAQVSG